MQNNRITAADAFALLLIAFASIVGINQYTYGMYNHFITIPFIKSIIDPGLYPYDFLIAEKKYFYTYFNSLFALLSRSLNLSLPVLFFAFYCISLYATLIAVFKIALTLFREKAVAYFSIILLIFSFNTLGDIRTIESLFLERTFVLPVLLFSIYFFLEKKIIWSYVLVGIAFLLHPLSAVYVLAGILLCTILSVGSFGWKKIVVALFLLFIIISPVLYLKVINPAPSLGLFNPDKDWLDLLRLRSSHHVYPFTWGWRIFLQAIMFIAAFAISLEHKPEYWYHRTVMIFCSAVLLMCVAGTIFTEFLPVSIIVQFQLFRSFVFLIYFGVIYCSNFFFKESKKFSPLPFITLILFAAIFYNDNLSKFAGFFVVLLLIFPGYGVASKIENLKKFYFPFIILLLLGLGISGTYLRGGLTIQSSQPKDWLDVQKWARDNTAKDAAFIVAPNWEGFRVEGERTVYGDWKDGTQMFFNPAFGKEWIRRMKMLGYVDDSKLLETYTSLNEQDIEKVKEELNIYSSVYLVMPAVKTFPYRESYSNEKFRVYQIK